MCILLKLDYAKFGLLTCFFSKVIEEKPLEGKRRVNKLSAEEMDKLSSNYKAKLSGQMVKSVGKSIIRMYFMGA